ncbi:MAG TPA: preprotein translocase subunit SecE [Terriglobales bacterium]
MAKAAVATTNAGDTRGKSWLERTKEFINDVRSEMKKVSYPNAKEVQSTTLVVIITVFIFAAFFYIVDQVIQFGLDRLLHAFK